MTNNDFLLTLVHDPWALVKPELSLIVLLPFLSDYIFLVMNRLCRILKIIFINNAYGII